MIFFSVCLPGWMAVCLSFNVCSVLSVMYASLVVFYACLYACPSVCLSVCVCLGASGHSRFKWCTGNAYVLPWILYRFLPACFKSVCLFLYLSVILLVCLSLCVWFCLCSSVRYQLIQLYFVSVCLLVCLCLILFLLCLCVWVDFKTNNKHSMHAP